MAAIRVGNAPVSFGIFEAAFGPTRQLPWPVVLDGIAQAGYEGTELGPYGYLPTNPQSLASELAKRNLGLGSSFVPVALADPAALDSAVVEVLTVGRLLATQGVREVIVADSGDDIRVATAGMDGPSWSDAQWDTAIRTFDVLGRALRRELDMGIVVHHHAGTYLETPAEIARLLDSTDPERVNLLLDTGHYVYGGGDPVALMQERGDRIRYLHYKDLDAVKMASIRANRIDMRTAWRQGVFVPLGKGCIDFPALTRILRERDYSGWIIVEQDTVADDDGRLDPDPFVSARESRDYLKGLGL
jgi:inosose dehydratase